MFETIFHLCLCFFFLYFLHFPVIWVDESGETAFLSIESSTRRMTRAYLKLHIWRRNLSWVTVPSEMQHRGSYLLKGNNELIFQITIILLKAVCMSLSETWPFLFQQQKSSLHGSPSASPALYTTLYSYAFFCQRISHKSTKICWTTCSFSREVGWPAFKSNKTSCYSRGKVSLAIRLIHVVCHNW